MVQQADDGAPVGWQLRNVPLEVSQEVASCQQIVSSNATSSLAAHLSVISDKATGLRR
jgi:hypothetical protein